MNTKEKIIPWIMKAIASIENKDGTYFSTVERLTWKHKSLYFKTPVADFPTKIVVEIGCSEFCKNMRCFTLGEALDESRIDYYANSRLVPNELFDLLPVFDFYAISNMGSVVTLGYHQNDVSLSPIVVHFIYIPPSVNERIAYGDFVSRLLTQKTT